MNSNKSSIKHICIDGQEILFFDADDWEDLKLNPVLDNMPIAIQDSVWSSLKIVQQYPELHLGLSQISIWKKWMPYVFLEIDSGFQRGHLETLTCDNCGWRGYTVNPMVIDPYIGDGINQDYITLMRLAEIHSVLPCPNCGTRLPRHPIWVEPI
jgi:predicted RNA-binding Zn-ribbon protein involved in translation (DUF1610 family)